MATWATLDDLKADLGIDDTRDDAKLRVVLDAAVAFVERNRRDLFLDPTSGAQLADPLVPADVKLGALRLAGRWHTRRRSPDGLVDFGELGVGRVGKVDPDIERLLGLTPVIA